MKRCSALLVLLALMVLPNAGFAFALTCSEAWQQCSAFIANQPPACNVLGCPDPRPTYQYRCEVMPNGWEMMAQKLTTPPGTTWTNMQAWAFTGGVNCPAGQEPAPGGGCRCEGGYAFDPFNPSQCLNANKCLARNADLSDAPRVGSSSAVCTGGCEYKIVESCGTVTVGGTQTTCGVWEYSGNPCGGLPPPGPGEGPGDPPAPQKCTPAGDGQTFCLKPDGNHCASASTGRQICWRPGETGEKDDGPIKQKRDAGHDPIPPNLQLPSGDSLSPVGQPVRAVTNVNNQTINTVTQNYQTTHGTNAGSSNKGESASGDGSGKDEGEGSASGGGDCKTPPITSGDPVLGMVATQAWHTRCAVEAGNAAKVTGDVADCKQPFTVEGTNANAIKLRAMRAQLCNGDKNGNGRPDWTETNGTETPEPGEGEEEPGVLSKFINTDALDGGGFLGGSGSCPAMGTVDLHFVQVDLSNASWWCPFVSMCRAILLLMGAYIAIRLLME